MTGRHRLALVPGWDWVFALLAVVAVVAFLVLELLSLHAGFRDYDEGVYWQSLRAMAKGQPLFTPVFASEPPVFYYALLPFYVVGHSIAGLRSGVLVFALIGLAGAYLAGYSLDRTRGGVVSMALVATAPFYIDDASVLQSDGPSIALAMLALGLVMVGVRQPGRYRLLLVGVAGLVFVLATGTKLSGVTVGLPMLLVLLGNRQARLATFMAAVLGGFVALGAVLMPVVGDWRTAYQDLVHSHLGAGQALHASLGINFPSLVLGRERPLEALAALSAVVAIARRDSRVVVPLTWMLETVTAILVYQPLFLHHLVQLVPPLALLGTVGISNLQGLRHAVTAGGMALLLLVSGYGIYAGVRHTQVNLSSGAHEAAIAAALRQASQPSDYIISDNPYAVALADRDIPAPVVDTSRQLIATGLLRLSDLEAAAQRYHVQIVLLDGDRLTSMPGFPSWLTEHYKLIRSLDGGSALYRRSVP